MTLTFRALCYLHAYDNSLPIQNGLAFESMLRKFRLDYSVQSLARIDDFLDALRKTGQFRKESYLDDPAKQNLLCLLAFYVGEVIGRGLRSQPHWFTYDEIQSDSQVISGRIFENSAALAFPDCQQAATNTFLPLVPITARLFSEVVDKSILHSAGFLLRPELQKEPIIRKPLPPPPAKRWPVDVATLASQQDLASHSKLDLPPWATEDDLRNLFNNSQILLNEGRIVWGGLGSG